MPHRLPSYMLSLDSQRLTKRNQKPGIQREKDPRHSRSGFSNAALLLGTSQFSQITLIFLFCRLGGERPVMKWRGCSTGSQEGPKSSAAPAPGAAPERRSWRRSGKDAPSQPFPRGGGARSHSPSQQLSPLPGHLPSAPSSVPPCQPPGLAPRPRSPTRPAPLTPAPGGCTARLRAPAAPPGLGPGRGRLHPQSLVSSSPRLPEPGGGGVVSRLQRLTRELERPGQHCRHGGGPGARARARVLSGNVVPGGRCAGLGPKR